MHHSCCHDRHGVVAGFRASSATIEDRRAPAAARVGARHSARDPPSTRDGGDFSSIAFVSIYPQNTTSVRRPRTWPYIDVRELGTDEAVSCVQTVRKNFEGLTKRQVEGAILAGKLQASTGHLTDERFKQLVSSPRVRNCKVNDRDVTHKCLIFGKSRAVIRGSTTRVKPDRVKAEYIDIPRDFYRLHKFVTLTADVMFVNGLGFLTTFSRDLRFHTAEYVPTRTAKQLSSSLKKIIQLYGRGGFVIRVILMDMEFDKVADLLDLVKCNTTAAVEHVAEIERAHRTIKERARRVVAELPFACLPRIVLRVGIDLEKDAPFPFGAYVEPSTDDETTNTMKSRTHGAIFLGTKNNLQRSLKVLDLRTGKVVVRRVAQELPMPGRVMRRVNLWGKRSKQEKFGKTLSFLNRVKKEFDWENDDLDPVEIVQQAEEQRVHPEILDEMPGITCEEDIQAGTAVVDEPAASAAQRVAAIRQQAEGTPPSSAVRPKVSFADAVRNPPLDPGLLPEVKTELEEEGEGAEHDAADATPSEAVEAVEGTDGMNNEDVAEAIQDSLGESRYPVRQLAQPSILNIQHPSSYANTQSYDSQAAEIAEGVVHVNIAEDLPEHFAQEPDVEYVLGVALAQTFSLAEGIRRFGDKAKLATKKEFKQFQDLEAMSPVDGNQLSYNERRRALGALLFLTEKRDGRIKARCPVNGAPQREYIKRQDAASPTIANESVKLTCAIEAKERRCVKVFDIPGAFLQSDLDEHVIMVFRGHLAELMAEVNPNFISAVYGLLRASLIFYKKMVADLTADGFTLNPYDPCVANKMINGKQMTIGWHVDDCKVSHVEEAEVDKLIARFRDMYGEGLAVQNGPYLDYLGTHIHYPGDGTVQFSQIPYIAKIFDDFPEEIKSTSTSPAADHLFNVRDVEEATFLDTERADALHHCVAQLSFLKARSRPDLDPAVAFLTTRVRKPDEDDWGKLRRVLQYLKGTRHMKLTISVDSLNILNWWVDASYNIHEDCKGHTGLILSMGKGGVASGSWKQKINVRSSTEGELVGLDDCLPLILWGKYFLEAQGYTVDHNIVRQDNQSTLLLARNGKLSSGKRTKHIKARYFNITDKVDSGDLELRYEPTESMWSDILNKPKQGQAFREFRAFLMNVPKNYDDEVERLRTPADLLPREGSRVDTDTLITAAKGLMST
ncbi:hypothetical protein THAOC_18763, partial [Thalassiosira oceanica]